MRRWLVMLMMVMWPMGAAQVRCVEAVRPVQEAETACCSEDCCCGPAVCACSGEDTEPQGRDEQPVPVRRAAVEWLGMTQATGMQIELHQEQRVKPGPVVAAAARSAQVRQALLGTWTT